MSEPARAEEILLVSVDTAHQGEQLAAGSCSQAFRLRYRDPKRTLKDSEVDEAHAKIRAALEKQFGAQLRA